MQKTITVAGKRFTSNHVTSLIGHDNKVTLNGVTFDVTYRKDEHNMFEVTKRNEAKFALLWAGGYKYAIVLPLEAHAYTV